MEVFILLLSSLISLISPVNFAGDQIAARAIRAQLKSAEQLQVRIDNAPVHNIAAGKADRIRIAGRGLVPLEGIRLDALEIETDPINVSRRQLLQKSRKLVLEEPVGVALRVVVRDQDVVAALKSPLATRQIQRLLRVDQYQILTSQVKFSDDQRVAIDLEIQETKTAEKLRLEFQSGVEIVQGRRINFLQPTARLNGQPIPDQLLKNLTEGVAQQFALDRIEQRLNVRAQILRLRFTQNSLEVAAFVGLPAGFRI